MLHEQPGDLLLPAGPSRRRVGVLAHIDDERRWGHQVEDSRADQAVVQDDIGPRQQRGAPPCEQAGVARAGSDQVHRHGKASDQPSKPSMAAPPPSTRARATAAPRASGSSPSRVMRITM